jgi:hypothetical protein
VCPYKVSHARYITWFIGAYCASLEFNALQQTLTTIYPKLIMDIRQYSKLKDDIPAQELFEQNIADFSDTTDAAVEQLGITREHLRRAEHQLQLLVTRRRKVNAITGPESTVEVVDNHVHAVKVFAHELQHLTLIIQRVSTISLDDCISLASNSNTLLAGFPISMQSLLRPPAILKTVPLKLQVSTKQVIDWSFAKEKSRYDGVIPEDIYPTPTRVNRR